MPYIISEYFADKFNINILPLTFPHSTNKKCNPGAFPSKHICCCKIELQLTIIVFTHLQNVTKYLKRPVTISYSLKCHHFGDWEGLYILAGL